MWYCFFSGFLDREFKRAALIWNWNVRSLTFNQFNASLLNKSMNFFKQIPFWPQMEWYCINNKHFHYVILFHQCLYGMSKLAVKNQRMRLLWKFHQIWRIWAFWRILCYPLCCGNQINGSLDVCKLRWMLFRGSSRRSGCYLYKKMTQSKDWEIEGKDGKRLRIVWLSV